MTGTKAFIDTNIFVYAVDESPSERRKHDISAHLLAEDKSARAVSTQVLQEFYVTVTRTLNTLMSPERAGQAVRRMSTLDVVRLDESLVLEAISTSQAAMMSLWDALIVEAARAAGCARILTEDLSHGQVIRGVEVVNPFLG